MAVAALWAAPVVPAVQAATYYSTNILNDSPLLYWSFDESEGNAQQLAPLGPPPPVTTENDLLAVSGAGRVNHADIGGLPKLGRAANFNGANFFRADTLRTAGASLNAPWAVEFWMQATGPNTGNRADYLINFGNVSADNSPAFIYDFEPDTLEVFGGSAGRTGSSPAVADTNWHHVVWVFYGDGITGVANRCELWLDGVNAGNVRDTYSRAIKLNQRLLVGAASAAGANGFEGRLDELAVYDLSGYGDETGVGAKVTQLVGDHYLEGTVDTGNAYGEAVLADAPLLYWNFDEESGNALQKATITLPLPVNSQNQLIAQAGATRIAHEAIGSGFQLGNALDLSGANYFQAVDLDVGIGSVGAPWAVEFWMQVGGANTLGSGDRQDYLLNIGANAPAFIYDYKPEQLEIYSSVRTDNGPVIRDTNWHHVLWVFFGDGSTGVSSRVEAFVDGLNLGRDVRNNFTRALNVSDQLLVGAALTDGTGGFTGRMDELAVYRLTGLASEAAVRARATLLASNHYLAAFGPPGNAVITITSQPADATAQKGGTASFTVTATVAGAPADSLTYQWLRNGSPIGGATARVYTTPVLSLGDLGTNSYAVRVGTLGGVFLLSRDALLTVPVPPYEPTFYTGLVLQDNPFLYWNFDENAGNALQRAPLGTPPPVTTENDLLPVAGAKRVASTGKLGSAASLSGSDFFQAAALRAGKASLAAPWACEFWLKVEGDNSTDRQDYLVNFGNDPGGDNAPAFIYDFKPNQLEVFGGAAGRTENNPLLNDAAWHHVVWVFYGDGTVGVADRLDAYLDGVLVPNVRGSFSRSFKLNEGLLVGAATVAGVNGFEGSLDELAVYDLGGLADEAAVTAKAQSLASHYAQAFSANPVAYSTVILAAAPVLYWNFDEADGPARQLVPVTIPPYDNTRNELVPVLSAGRVEHSLSGGLFLGNAASFSGLNFFQALDLETAKTILPAPWAVEFWMQATGENTANRADYLLNFGTSPDNYPAFIYDFKPDQLEVYGGEGGRSDNGPILADANWHHVLWVFYGDGASGVADRLEAWVDGVNLGNARNNYSRGVKVSEQLLVGAALANAANGFEGHLDELAVYDWSGLGSEAAVAAKAQDLVTRHRGAATNPPPRLAMARSATQLTLSWTRTGFVLQENSNLANAAGWSDVTGGSTSPVTLTLPASGHNFYRLRSQ